MTVVNSMVTVQASSVMIMVLLFLGLTTGIGYAQQQKTICVLAPIDQTIGPNNISTALDVISEHNDIAKYIPLIEELTDKANSIKSCDIVVQFQRMNNQNNVGYQTGNPQTSHYTISGNTITLFTNTTPVVPNSGASGSQSTSSPGKGGSVFALPMTNWACLGLAQGSYHQNLGNTGSTYCNPYATSSSHNPNHDTPVVIVKQSLEKALKVFGV